MKKIEMSDVPEHVWYGVHAKWKFALQNRWHNDIWNRCELCKFMGIDADCRDCPIYVDSWCRGIQESSRLSIKYHTRKVIRSKLPWFTPACAVWLVNFVHTVLYNDIILRDEVNDSWHEEVKDFIKYIEPYCGPGPAYDYDR